jgi:hypothetical protein
MVFIISNNLPSLDNKAINDISEIDQCSVKHLLICHCEERSDKHPLSIRTSDASMRSLLAGWHAKPPLIKTD